MFDKTKSNIMFKVIFDDLDEINFTIEYDEWHGYDAVKAFEIGEEKAHQIAELTGKELKVVAARMVAGDREFINMNAGYMDWNLAD